MPTEFDQKGSQNMIMPRTASPEPITQTEIASVLNGKTIYMLDDEDYPVEIIEAYLAGHNINFVAFNRAEPAIEQLKTVKPDLLLLDVMMPGMDGWDFYTRLRGIEGLTELPVLFVTCLSNEEVEPEMREGMLCATLSKPVIRKQLIEKIVELLR